MRKQFLFPCEDDVIQSSIYSTWYEYHYKLDHMPNVHNIRVS